MRGLCDTGSGRLVSSLAPVLAKAHLTAVVLIICFHCV